MKRKVEAVLDPFSGLDELPVGPSLLRDDEEEESVYGEGEEDEEADAANMVPKESTTATEVPNATGPGSPTSATAADTKTNEDEASLPMWMRAAHASVIAPKTPSAKELGLDGRLLAALKRMGVRRCFPVQAAVIPVVLAAHAGRCAADVCVCAPTGSGKTLAYALPVVQALLPRVVTRLRALVLLPTRGLAAQVHAIFSALVSGTPLRVGLAAAHEGISFERERAGLVTHTAAISGSRAAPGSAVDILVATPGRLVEHLQCTGGGFTLQHLQWLVVDEADRLISHNYQGWLERVLDSAHSEPSSSVAMPHSQGGAIADFFAPGADAHFTYRPRLGSAASHARAPPLAAHSQEPPLLKLLFSATLTRSAAKLAPLRLCRPRYFCVPGARYATPATLREWMITCADANEKPKLLVALLRRVLSRAEAAETTEDVSGAHKEAEEGVADGDEPAQDEAGAWPQDALEAEESLLAPDGTDAEGLDGGPSLAGADKVIVFTSSLESTHRLTRLLQLMLRMEVGEFSSAVPPRERTALLKTFASKRLRVLVASDAMARGMDVDGVDVVVNYDPPANIKGYVHRVGRTARAGRSGTSYTLLRTAEVHHFKRSMAKASKPWRPLELPDQQAALDSVSPEYARALDDLQLALEAERSGALEHTAPRVALEEAIGAATAKQM